MCDHSFGETLDGCRIIADPITGALKCWANRPPRPPLPRSAAQDRLAALGQGAPMLGEGTGDAARRGATHLPAQARPLRRPG